MSTWLLGLIGWGLALVVIVWFLWKSGQRRDELELDERRRRKLR